MSAETFDHWAKTELGSDMSGFAIQKIYKDFRKMLTPKLAAAAAMTKAVEIGYGENTMPVKFMEHFLYRKGEDRRIQLSKLFAEDKNVRDRVTMEVFRRVSGANTVREKREMANMTPIFPSNIDPVITIKQENYSNKEWKGSLGTYDLNIYHVLDFPSHAIAFLRSANVYKWHPDADRNTQGVHRFGAKMVEEKFAHNFAMPAVSTGFFVDKKYAEILKLSTLRQTDPHLGFGQRISEIADQAMRLAEEIL